MLKSIQFFKKMTSIELLKDENFKNGSVFTRKFQVDEQFDNAATQIAEISKGLAQYDTQLIHLHDKKYVWMNLNYDIDYSNTTFFKTQVPRSVCKYFNDSQNRLDYELSGDAFLEIFYFPKSEFPTYESFVKHLEEKYFTFVDKDLDIYDYVFEHNNKRFTRYNDVFVIKVQDLYAVTFSSFCGFEKLFADGTKDVNLYDFLPNGQGYDGKPQVRFRFLMKSDGNDFMQLLETDGGWIYWHHMTS